MANASKLLRAYATKYSELVKAVMLAHRHLTKNHAHDWTHALFVAMYGVIIAANERLGELAFIAGLCHTTDHLYGKERIAEIVDVYLSLCPGLSDLEKAAVAEAVLTHGKKNDPDDCPVTVTLKDADKLGNLGILMSAMRYVLQEPNQPIFDLRFVTKNDPEAIFKKPLTTLRDLKYAMEWEEPGWFRCPKAKDIAERRFNCMRIALSELEEQVRETGLSEIPDELIMPPPSPNEIQEHI